MKEILIKQIENIDENSIDGAGTLRMMYYLMREYLKEAQGVEVHEARTN